MRCKGWKCNLRKTITVTYGAFCGARLFLSVTLIYLNGIYRGPRGQCSGRQKHREKAVRPIPTNPRFLHYLWLLATEILN